MMSSPNIPLQSLIGLGLQLILSHLVAALVALWLADAGSLAVLVAIIAGLLLSTTLLRTVWLLASAIDRLGQGITAAPLPLHGHFLLAGLPARLNLLIEWVSNVTALHGTLVQQTSEAAAQQERNRLARDLHDSIKQQIFSISMSAAAIEARWEQNLPSARQALADVRQSAREALVEMTALLQQLSPAPLEKVGLVQALRDQCEALGYRSGAEVIPTFGTLPDDERLPRGAQESLFRIAQEALSNIARHARASQVWLDLSQADNSLWLNISDNGQGFNHEMARQGMGLGNIEQRVATLGGKLTLASVPGSGTRLSVMIPLQEPLFTQEEKVGIQADHTLNRTFLAGAGGGLLLIATLFYPLYIDWPGRFVEGWSEGDVGISLLLIVLAALLTVATGYAAARWTEVGRSIAGAVIGALAGLVAATTAYVVLVSPAAGLGASATFLEHGYRPALGEPHMLWLLAESIVNIVYWNYAALGVMQVAGLLLGGLGSLFATPSNAPLSRPELRRVATSLAWLAVVINGLAFIVAQAIFPIMDRQVSVRTPSMQPFAEFIAPYSISLPTAGVSLIPLSTALLLLTVSLVGLYLLRVGQRPDLETALGIPLFASYIVLQLLFLYGQWGSTMTPPHALALIVAGTLISVTFGGLLLKQRGWKRSDLSVGLWDVFVLAVPLMLLSTAILMNPGNWYRARAILTAILAGGWILYRVRAFLRKVASTYSLERANYEWQNALNTLGIGFPLALLLMSQVVPVGLNLMLIQVPGIPALAAYETTPFTDQAAIVEAMAISPAEVVRDLYSNHAQFLLGTLLVIFVAEAILLGVLRLLQIVARRYGKHPLAPIPGGQQP